MNWTEFFFSFRGRLNRAKYWLFILIYTVSAMIVGGIAVAIFASGNPTVAASIVFAVVALAWFIVILIGSLAVGVKRLHDRDKSGWWLLLFYLVPSLFSGAGQGAGAAGSAIAQAVCGLIAFAIGIWGFVELGCLPGTQGPNRYGPDPLAAPTPATAR